MDHHGTDRGAVAPGRAGAGPGGPVGAPGGPEAGNGADGAVTGRVRPDAAAAGSGGAGAGTADRVWAVLLLNPDPIEWKELAEASGVTRVAALEALLGFLNAGYLLHIPLQREGRFPRPDLWVLAGGVREQYGVSDAVRISLLAKLSAAAEDGQGGGRFWPDALELGVIAPPVPISPVSGLPKLPRRWLKELVLEVLIAEWPHELSVGAIAARLGGRSHGAVRISADELCTEERAVCTDLAVKKYAAFSPDGSPIASPGGHENLA